MSFPFFFLFRFYLLDVVVAYQRTGLDWPGLDWTGLAGGKRGKRMGGGTDASVAFSSEVAVLPTTTDCLGGGNGMARAWMWALSV